MHAVNN